MTVDRRASSNASTPTRTGIRAPFVGPLADVIVGDIRPTLWLLLGGAALLLVIACVNVVSLLLVRTESRRRELSVRLALGASRARIVRHFVTEAGVLVAIGAVLALVVADAGMRLMAGLIPADMQADAAVPRRARRQPRRRGLRRRGGARRARHLLARPAAGRTRPTDVRAGMADGGRGAVGPRVAPDRREARGRRAGDGDGAARRRRPPGPQPVSPAERRARLPAGSSRHRPRRGARRALRPAGRGRAAGARRRAAGGARCPASRGRADQRAAGQLQRQHDLAPLRRPAVQRRAQRGEPARRQPGLPRDARGAAASPAATSPPPTTPPSRRSW